MDILPDTFSDPVEAFSVEMPWTFWRLLENFSLEEWLTAAQASLESLGGIKALDQRMDLNLLLKDILSEGQFGRDHWRLSASKRFYYQFVRPLLPYFLRVYLRTFFLSRQRDGFALNWPIEDRYVNFQFDLVAQLLAKHPRETIPFVNFWPGRKRFAFVLTHDVESSAGQDFVRETAALDESYGFHSSFNFVPEKYPVDLDLIRELKQRGFEVGVHGLKHDGRLFSSRSVFRERAKKINSYLKDWNADGFRSPMTHRNPEWMQALDVEYDLSFFDTDPFEPISGGTMSIWPFSMGRFVELPYTLVQDYTLMVTLGETTPRIWLDKVDFIKKYYGMALVNVHPDYLPEGNHLAIYSDFLSKMKNHTECWSALPRDVASWWKKRAMVSLEIGNDGKVIVPSYASEITIGNIGISGMIGQSKELLINLDGV
jgi:peptidoglycan/xylan/chitin deacetylase (PgdA/CDA1 family)